MLFRSDGKTFAFASELKALARFHSSQLNPEAVRAYTELGYIPAPLAIFRSCHKLPPGHLLRFRDGVHVERWFHPEDGQPSSDTLSAQVQRATSLRLAPDTALALSGGVDSSVLAWELRESGIPAISVRVEGAVNEIPAASAVAQWCRLPHHIAELRSEDVPDLFERAVELYDEPFADSSSLPSLVLARAAAQSHRILITGEGGRSEEHTSELQSH